MLSAGISVYCERQAQLHRAVSLGDRLSDGRETGTRERNDRRLGINIELFRGVAATRRVISFGRLAAAPGGKHGK